MSRFSTTKKEVSTINPGCHYNDVWLLTGRLDAGHVLHFGLLLFLVGGVVVVQDVQHRLGILLLLHLGNVGLRQQLSP